MNRRFCIGCRKELPPINFFKESSKTCKECDWKKNIQNFCKKYDIPFDEEEYNKIVNKAKEKDINEWYDIRRFSYGRYLKKMEKKNNADVDNRV